MCIWEKKECVDCSTWQHYFWSEEIDFSFCDVFLADFCLINNLLFESWLSDWSFIMYWYSESAFRYHWFGPVKYVLLLHPLCVRLLGFTNSFYPWCRFVLNTCKRLKEKKSYLVWNAVGCLGVTAVNDLVREVCNAYVEQLCTTWEFIS